MARLADVFNNEINAALNVIFGYVAVTKIC